jgi:small-conductance mechanosensitive channel
MTPEFGFSIPLPLLIAGPLVVLAGGAVGVVIARVVFAIIASGLRRTQSPTNEIVLEVLRAPIDAAGVLVGAWLALRGLPLSPESVRFVNRGWVILTTVLLVSVGLRSLNGITKGIVEKTPTLAPAAGMIRAIGRLIVLSLGGVMLLQSFGIAVEPLIASLGIGSLAVALALRDTLANFFAGIYIHADHPLRVGNYVKIENGEEGYVTQIGWRSTRLRSLANNMIVVPNEKLAQSIMTNYDIPDGTCAFAIQIPVAYDADPARILGILTEELTSAAPELPALLLDPAPSAAFGGFTENSLTFSLNCRVRNHVAQYGVRSELQRRVYERFLREGIRFPFPSRTLHVPEIEAILARRLSESGSKDPKG